MVQFLQDLHLKTLYARLRTVVRLKNANKAVFAFVLYLYRITLRDQNHKDLSGAFFFLDPGSTRQFRACRDVSPSGAA